MKNTLVALLQVGITFAVLSWSHTATASVCGKAIEDSSVSLSCPSGQVVSKVAFASYGTPSGSCGAFKVGSCNASNSLSKVSSSCLGKASCKVSASNSVFGDPCSGVDKTLAIQLQCAAPAPSPTPSPSSTVPVVVASGAVSSGLGAGLCLDVSAENMAPGTPLQIWSCNGGANQAYVLNSSGQLKSFGGNGSLCLDIQGSGSNLDPIVSNACSGAASQKWSLSNGALIHASSKRCIDVTGSSTQEGTPVILYDCSGGSNQKWSFASGASPSPSSSPSNSLVTDSVFAPTSFWYTPIPANAPLNAKSASMVKDFQNQIAHYYGTVSLNTDAYTSPVYIPKSTDPIVKVNVFDCQNRGWIDSGLQAQFAQVPMPAYALASAGTDEEMTIYQPSSDTIFEFWQMEKVGSQWQACWGGRMQQASKNPGYFSSSYGTTATGLPFLGGMITAEELQRGEIRHAIGVALPAPLSYAVVSWPAQRSDGWASAASGALIPEGQRFRLDPSVNVDALNISSVAKIIAKAAQKYGFVVWDKSGSVALRAENVMSYTAVGKIDPYHGANGSSGLFQGQADWQVLQGFPWDKLQFLPMDYGKP